MEALSVETLLGLVGLVILVGLAGEVGFKRTGIPSVLFLMGLGVLLGPVLGLADAASIAFLAPYFGTLALLIILFDGGLNLQFMKVLQETPLALLYSVLVFGGSVLGVAMVYVWGLGGQWRQGLLLGAILGGTAAAIILPVVSKLPSLREPTKVLVSLDSAFSEVFVVVIALALMGSFTQIGGKFGVVRELFHSFFDALVLAALAGAVWARLLTWLAGQTLSYMLTLAAILVLYYVAEVLGASGAITILLFGLVLANMESLAGRLVRPLRVLIGYELDKAKFVLDEFLKRINEELAFLVRTFFYVLLGLIVDFSRFDWTIAMWGLVFFAVVVGMRIAVTYGIGITTKSWTSKERVLISAMMPRGVATAVMAFLPASAGIPNTENFPMYALTVISLGVVFMTLSLAIYRHLTGNEREAPSPSLKVSEARS
ncbi:cation:proton antiporter domain-containing protein [Petrachloros mirabilis]|jgi:cell volume regulation protein A